MPVPKGSRSGLVIISLNIEGLKHNAAYLNELLNKYPKAIFCIQEHWLYRYQEDEIKELFLAARSAIKCVDDDEPLPPTHRCQGHAGVACIWDIDLDPYITVIPDGSHRTLALSIAHEEGNLLLINSYMPTQGTNTESDKNFTGVLDEIYEVIEMYRNTHKNRITKILTQTAIACSPATKKGKTKKKTFNGTQA
jgi:exonuclease III